MVPRVQFPRCSLALIYNLVPPMPPGLPLTGPVSSPEGKSLRHGRPRPPLLGWGVPRRVCADSDSPAFTPPFCFVPRGRLLAGKRRCG